MAEKQSTTRKKKTTAVRSTRSVTKTSEKSVGSNPKAVKKQRSKTVAAKKDMRPASSVKQSKIDKSKLFGRKKKAPKVITTQSLYLWNKWLALIHLLQGALIIVLSLGKTTTFPVVTNFLAIDPLATGQNETPVLVPASEHIADINLAYLVAGFFFISAIAHAIVATIYRKRYEANLVIGVNKARWIEYSLSASTMIVGIGALVGVVSLSAFIMLFALTAVMNLLGLIMEVMNQGHSKINWIAYIVGCIAGIVPWIVISEYLISGALYGDTAPTFVYFIFFSMFLFFSSFALNMYLQYAKIGKWKDYMYGERAYMLLSLIAKTALAWQVFAGTLRP